MAYEFSATIESESEISESGSASEKFRMEVRLPGNASDTSLTLGTITDPLYIAVIGAEGVSFKLGSGGTDSIGAYPLGFVSDLKGLDESVVLLSNSKPTEQTVTVLAAE